MGTVKIKIIESRYISFVELLRGINIQNADIDFLTRML